MPIFDSLEVAIDAYKHGNWAKTAGACEEGIQLAESAGDEISVCRFRLLLSLCYWAQGRIKESFVLPAPPEGYGVGGLEIAARIRNQKGFMLAQTGKFQEAKKELDEALRISQQAGMEALSAEVQINRGTLFFYLRDYSSMEKCARAVLEITEKNGDRGAFASGCAGIGKSFMLRQQWAEAIAWFERALSAFEADNSPYYARGMRGEIGNCYLGLGDLDNAMRYFSEALKSSEAAGGLADMHRDYANIGCVYLRRGEYQSALSHFTKAVEIARGLGDQISIAKWLNNVSLTYRCMGDTARSASYALEAEIVNREIAQARAAATS
jgi:tetratricopeptide (TPR) repeat protein